VAGGCVATSTAKLPTAKMSTKITKMFIFKKTFILLTLPLRRWKLANVALVDLVKMV
jgi:hypothetical protein